MATSTELAIAIFGVAPGGYQSFLDNYYNANGEVGLAEELVTLLHQVYGSSVATNSGLASFLTTNLVGNSVSTANQQFLTNYITTELNNGVDAGALVDSLVNIVDSIQPGDANWGNAHDLFANKVSVADYYNQIGGSSTDLPTLTGIVSGINNTTNSTVNEVDSLTTTGVTQADFYVYVSSGYSAYIDHSAASHNNVDSTSWTYNNVGGDLIGIASNSFDNTSYYFLALGYASTPHFAYPFGDVLNQLSDGTVTFGNTLNYYFYTPGASSYENLAITNNSGSYNVFTGVAWNNVSNDVLLGGQENSVANANMDAYLVMTDHSGNVLHQVRIEDTTSPTSSVSVSNLWMLDNGNSLVELNHKDYVVLDSSLQAKETFTLESPGLNGTPTIVSLHDNGNGTYVALDSLGYIENLDSNFNVTSFSTLQFAGHTNTVPIYGMTADSNGNIYVRTADLNGHSVISKISGTDAGAAISSTYLITNVQTQNNNMSYDNGLLYAHLNTSTLFSFNPDSGVTADPTGTYKINTENLTGTLVAVPSNDYQVSSVVTTGGGPFQVHSDVNLVGVTTGSAYALHTSAGIFTHGSMGTIA